jgi:hypothetical protein
MIIENKIALYATIQHPDVLLYKEIPNTALLMIRESHIKIVKNITESICSNGFSNVSVAIDPDIYLISSDGSIYSKETIGFVNLSINIDSATMVVYSKNICGSKIEIKL